MALLVTFGAKHLISWVDLLDKKVWSRYEQPVWSEDESQVAFIHYQIDPEEPNRSIDKQLCVVSRVDGEVRNVAHLGEQDLHLLGWLDSDKRLLLMPGKRVDGLPRLWTVTVADGNLQETHFARTDIELVSIRGGEVFFRRRGTSTNWDVPSSVAPVLDDAPPTPTPSLTPAQSATPSPTPGLTREQLELLSWTPGQDSIKPICSIPLEGDDIQIEDVAPSPDHQWVALILRVGDEKALWLYSHKEQRLRYSHIKLATRAIRLAWSWDSTGLVAAAELSSGCDFFVSYNVERGDFAVLHANAAGRAYTPFWPRGEKDFLLLDRGEIWRFNLATLQATPVLGRVHKGKRAESSAISPRGSWIVFRSREGNDDILYNLSVKVNEVKPLLNTPAPSESRNSIAYLLGDGLRNAYRYWRGIPPRLDETSAPKR